jgi:outer membrane receptor protein involved in Fe transport
MSRSIAAGATALALFHGAAFAAPTDAELAEIRAQLRELRAQYESRIQALEARLKEAEARPSAPAPTVAPTAAPARAAVGPSNANAFNPAISVILQGTYAHLPERETTGGKRGFSLGESELVLSANVDPHFSGTLIASVTPEDTIGVEEAYGIWTGAPAGLVPKFGRFLSGIGYLNEQHSHAWDFVDAPLAYEAFLGGRYANDGLQVRWLAPTEHYIELGAEAGRGSSFPGTERDRNGAGSTAAFAHTGGDIGASSSWRAGLSLLRVRELDSGLEGSRNTAIADFVWKYAPGGNARETNFKLQGELLKRGDQKGGYLQAVYQWHPEWRAGIRWDRLDAASGFDSKPRRASAMVDYNPSEFSRLRLQYARSETLPGVTDNQWFVQYILSLGAHGAHKY